MIFTYFLSVVLAFVSFALGIYIVKVAVLKLVAQLAILALGEMRDLFLSVVLL